jgi:hypothetical protein
MMNKEQFLIDLENQFDNSSWSEIIELVDKVITLNKPDETCNSIINYVRTNNKITFKQWKVLRIHVKENSEKKFKHGNE